MTTSNPEPSTWTLHSAERLTGRWVQVVVFLYLFDSETSYLVLFTVAGA